MRSKHIEKFCFLTIIFFSGALIGKIYETLYYLIVKHELFNTGSMFGPWIPVYGFGALLISFLIPFKKHPSVIFILTMLLTGILEYFTGLWMDKVVHTRLWTYDGLFLNINGYVCLRSVVSFGVGGLLLVYLLYPIIKKLMQKVKMVYIKYFCIIIVVIYVIDFFLSLFFKECHTF